MKCIRVYVLYKNGGAVFCTFHKLSCELAIQYNEILPNLRMSKARQWSLKIFGE
jgi:hypothetical protein